MSVNLFDLTGETIGSLKVLYKSPIEKYGYIEWVCSCTCGKEILVTQPKLMTKQIVSCGCRKNSFKVGDVFGNLEVVETLDYARVMRNHIPYGTPRQKEQTIELLKNRVIFSQDKTNLLKKINKLTEEQAAYSINKLKVVIKESENGCIYN
jgi:hypothetical protein